MATWKMPPIAKIYEAFSAIADERVNVISQTEAEVKSSSGDKTYSVKWTEDIQSIISNDNASYWQGYIGYPIIAVLMALHEIRFNPSIVKQLAGIQWKRINDKFKRDYDKAVDNVLQEIEDGGGDRNAIIREVEMVYQQLEVLKLERGRRGKKPPKI